MTNRVRIVAAILICLTLVGLVTGVKYHADREARQARMTHLADLAVREQLWDKNDYMHWETIVNESRHGISNTDFDWMLSKMTEVSPPPGIDQKTIDVHIIAEFRDAGLTPSQSKEADTAALPLLKRDNEPGDTVGLMPEYACALFERYPDKRAVPDMLALVKSPHPWVRRTAAKALRVQGYNLPVPPRPTVW